MIISALTAPPPRLRLLPQHLGRLLRSATPPLLGIETWQWPSACFPALPRPMPSSGSVSRNRQRGRPMASRSFDGRVALLFGKTWLREGATSRRSGPCAGEESGAGGERKRNRWCGIGLTEGIGKTTFPKPRGRLGGETGEESRKAACKTGSEAASELRIPRVHSFRRLRALCERAARGASSAAANTGIYFPGSRRGSLRRAGAGARPPRSEEPRRPPGFWVLWVFAFLFRFCRVDRCRRGPRPSRHGGGVAARSWSARS